MEVLKLLDAAIFNLTRAFAALLQRGQGACSNNLRLAGRDMLHNHRCADCKHVVFRMLEATFGDVQPDPKVAIPARLEGHEGKPYFKALQKVRRRLEAYRGHTDWIRQWTLPRCDYRITLSDGRLCVVELDEKQHFSAARGIALANYPSTLPLGYSVERWRNLCSSVNARDNDPVDRDERRAWYDTLRDFLPLVSGYAPTVRIYMPDSIWCSLDPRSRRDKLRFKRLLKASAFGPNGDGSRDG